MTVMIDLTNGLAEGGRLSEKELNTRLQIRNATVAEFNSSNPVLLKGELVAVNEDGDYRLKIGDGTSTFSQLHFLDTPLRTLIGGKANVGHTHFLATTSMSGFMSSTDKAKLDGIDENANYYVHPSYTSRSSNLYRITVDSTGHVSSIAYVTADYLEDMGLQRRINYSTTEQATGETWWDGWPVYRKTISLGALTAGTRTTFSTGIASGKFRKLVRLWGTAKVTNDYIWNPIPQVDHTDPKCSIKVELETTNAVPYLVVFLGSNRSISEGYVTIEYTRGN